MTEENAIEQIEIETWEDLANKIAQMTPEQRKQKVQIARSHPCWDHVHELEHGIAFSSVGSLELAYCRSSVDNRHHDEEFVIYTDGNPHAEDGAIAYEWLEAGEEPDDDEDMESFLSKDKPIYPKDHDPSADCTVS